jgi:hypothetical protein
MFSLFFSCARGPEALLRFLVIVKMSDRFEARISWQVMGLFLN